MAGVTTGELHEVECVSGSAFEYVDARGQCDARYVCAACGCPANLPVLHDCAACFCMACASKNNDGKCTVCDEKIMGNTKPMTSKSVLAKLDALEVRCPVCKAVVKRCALATHLLACPTDCPRGCGVKVAPQNQAIHESTDCLNVFVICQSCNERLQRKFVMDLSHVKMDCPTSCLNGCGVKLKPRDMNEHINTKCPKSLVKCSSQFCAWSGPRSTISDHTSTCILLKISPALDSLVDENRSLQIEMNKLREESGQKVEVLQNEISLLRGQVVLLGNHFFPQGIRVNEPVQVLEGWNVHYKEPYSHSTRPCDIDPGRGEWILVASQKGGSEVLSLCAIGRRSEVCRRTQSLDTAVLHRGTYWYFVEGKSFGFTPKSTLGLQGFYCDACEDGAEKRLSWRLDGKLGGWRSGTTTFSSASDNLLAWLKIVCWI
ncbi:hypothetical protein Pelo_14629 [Pelomyxa schiedti]|nr:hypothetical protein Pelo_14629 [Pelomyxa schiedti]